MLHRDNIRTEPSQLPFQLEPSDPLGIDRPHCPLFNSDYIGRHRTLAIPRGRSQSRGEV